ncbi:MAG: DUF2065 domain-containing protein [Gammaproteobacteria bacterium]|nr:MAG: DUF2065 domain-containing protein [Gammaproteobacteria bacterium]
MMWTDLFSALALVLVLEGILPFVAPESLKRMYLAAAQMNDSTLRIMGLICMIFGVLMLYFIR